MNIPIVLFYISTVVMIEGMFFSLPALVALIYHEQTGWTFFIIMLACLLIGFIGSRRKPRNKKLFAREGFVIVALSWIVISIIGALPFVISREIPSFTDALFETVSGFTTTGASILGDVEALSHCMLFWRSFTHWIGGMGVFVFLIAILPLSGGENMYMLRAESPGPSVGKLVPRVRDTAKILYAIYISITLTEIIILIISGMPVFDSVTLSFGTAGTGGFGIKNSSVADYTVFQQGIISVFMILFGMNFNLYFLFLSKKFRQGFKLEETRWYIIIILASTIYSTYCVRGEFDTLFESFHHSLFQVASIITTTGFSTCDFNTWNSSPKTMLVILMFIGACAGSTGGGIKVSRFIIMLKSVKKELLYYIHPRSMKKVRIDGRPVEHEVVRSVNVFLISYIVVFVFSLILVSIEQKDITTNFTAVAATINNIGPGLEMVGPSSNYGSFNMLSKYVLMFDMLAGRLEIFPMLILFNWRTWKKNA